MSPMSTATAGFGLFQSELVILFAAVRTGQIAVAVAFVTAAAVAFVGIAALLLPMIQGRRAEPSSDRSEPESWLLVGPPLVLGVAVLILGVWVPPALDRVLHSAAAFLGD